MKKYLSLSLIIFSIKLFSQSIGGVSNYEEVGIDQMSIPLSEIRVLEFYDISGSLIKIESVGNFTEEFPIHIGNLSGGIYVIRAIGDWNWCKNTHQTMGDRRIVYWTKIIIITK
jgi:hypothetical protein